MDAIITWAKESYDLNETTHFVDSTTMNNAILRKREIEALKKAVVIWKSGRNIDWEMSSQ